MSKSPDAFRTISEVAEWLDTPAHVLRFWESRFRQVKPVKRAGGRRYYRPADMALLGGIKRLLHEDGMTIKGVQKILRDKGVKHVADMSMDVDSEIEQSDIDAAEARLMASIEEPVQEPEVVEVKVAPAPEAVPEPEAAKDQTLEAAPQPKAVATETTPEPAEVSKPEPVDTPAKVKPVVDVGDAPEAPAEDPVQLDLLAEPTPPPAEPQPEPESAALVDAATSVAEAADTTPSEDPSPAKPTTAAPRPIICDVPDDPTDESLVVDGTDGDTTLVMLLAANPEDFAGKSTALQALLDRISGADGKLADGV